MRVEGQPGVIRATAGDLTGLVALIDNPDPLRDRTLLALDKPRIDGIDISGDTRLRKTGLPPEWKLYGPPTPTDPQATNLQTVNRLLDALTERRTIKGVPGRERRELRAQRHAGRGEGLGRRVRRAAGRSTRRPSQSRKRPQSRSRSSSARPRATTVHVRRVMPDGAKADFVLPDKIKFGLSQDAVDLVGTLKKTRLDLLDPSLKTFSPEVASKVTVSGVANYDLDKDEKKDSSTGGERWTYAGPADKKGQTADAGTIAEMLRILGTTQSVTKFISEAPDEAALIGYGFVAPKMPANDAAAVASTEGDDRTEGRAADG